MKINVLLIGAFLTVVLLQAVLVYIGISELDAVKNKIAVSTASEGFMNAMLNDIINSHRYIGSNNSEKRAQLSEANEVYDALAEMWIEALIYGTDSSKFRESDAYKTWVEGGYPRVEYIPEISKLAEEMEGYLEKSEEADISTIAAYQRKIAAKTAFDGIYPEEKRIRYVIRGLGFASNDYNIVRATGNMLYHNKEAIFQYGDKKRLDEWFADIQTLKTTVANSIAYENRSLLLKYLDEYSPIARTMANLTLEMKQNEAEESAKLATFHELKDKLSEKTKAIKSVTSTLENEATMRMIRNMLPFTMGAVALVVLLGVYVSNSVSKPITKLTHVVDEISLGKLDATIEKSGNIDEVNKLEESLERVLTTMKRSVKRLENDDNDKKKDE